MRSVVAATCILAVLAPVLAAPQQPNAGAVTAAALAAESNAPHPPRQLGPPVDISLTATASGSVTSDASAASATISATASVTESATATSPVITVANVQLPPSPPFKRQITTDDPAATSGVTVVDVEPVVNPSGNFQPIVVQPTLNFEATQASS